MGNSLIDITGRYRNILRGIVPTFTGFSDINPTNLANSTDGDITTSTGEAKKTLASSGDIGYMTWDLGEDKNVFFGMLVGLRSSANSNILSCLIDPAAGNLNVYSAQAWAITSVSEQKQYTQTIQGRGRYLRGHFWAAGAGDFYVKVYEAFAYEVSL